MNIKKLIADSITLEVDGINFEKLIQKNDDEKNGDYALPCFSLAKILHSSPISIAENIKNSIKNSDFFDKIENVNGYLNFFINKKMFNQVILKDYFNGNFNFVFDDYKNKKLCIDYSSVNLAKYMHIGHLSTTIIGESIARLYEKMGYSIVRINYIGDYGTPFGKMIYAYLNWGNEKDLNEKGVDYLQDLYVQFYKKAEQDDTLEEKAREYFKLIEQKDEKIYPLYKKIIDISIKEAETLLNLLGVKFDSWKGESAYTSELNNVIKLLKNKNLLTESQGAEIVDLEKYNLGVCLIKKSDGSSLYATRDIAAAIDRFNTYNFDKMYYVTAVQQKLHFEQFFKVLELLGYNFSSNLKHIYYGMLSLKTGKIASRLGKQAILRDLMEYSINKASKIVEDRKFTIENKESVAQKIAMSALKFSALKTERAKDSIFDTEECFSFVGDTSTYMQYTYARISSIIRKANVENFDDINFSYLTSNESYNILSFINNYYEILCKAMEQNEPCIISKFTLDLCKLANKFYTNEKVITENVESTKSKVFLLKFVKETLSNLFNIICIDTVEEM